VQTEQGIIVYLRVNPMKHAEVSGQQFRRSINKKPSRHDWAFCLILGWEIAVNYYTTLSTIPSTNQEPK
jgi:hypothetical protein